MRSTIGLDLDGHIGNMDIFTGIDYNNNIRNNNAIRRTSRCATRYKRNVRRQ